MTTFQAIVFSIVHGFTQFLPLSANAHHKLLPFLVGWSEPGHAFLGALNLGALLALLIYFIHDWASMIASLLQVIIYRKKPMTLDERMPLFILISAVPVAGAWKYALEWLNQQEITLPMMTLIFAAASLPLWATDHFSRRNKNFYDWNILDALLAGIFQILALVPGCGSLEMIMTAGFLRNFSREGALKFAYLALMPFLMINSVYYLRDVEIHNAMPAADLTWLSFGVAVAVTVVSSLLAIGGLMKSSQKKGLGRLVFYRVALATVVGVVGWYRSRN